MKRYVLTPSAKKDVNDIWDNIDSIEAADRVRDALESAMVKLAKNRALVIGVKSWRINVLSQCPNEILNQMPQAS